MKPSPMLHLLRFPWARTDPGRGFFIPCLDTRPVRYRGLAAALKLGLMDARAVVGIKGGAIGVLFYRLPRKSRVRLRSVPSEVFSAVHPSPKCSESGGSE